MTPISISKKRESNSTSSLIMNYQGFRPFFIGAALASVSSMLFWLLVLSGAHSPALATLSPSQWHGHEMVFGYTFAVIAGFLLTAVGSWTGVVPAKGITLLLPFVPWCIARGAWLAGERFFALAALADCIFGCVLVGLLLRSVVVTKTWKQVGVISKVTLLTACNFLFYLSLFEVIADYRSSLLLVATYVIVALILTIGFRVLPSYVQNTLDLEPLPQDRHEFTYSIATLILFVALLFNKLLFSAELMSSLLSCGLFIVTTLRLSKIFYYRIYTKPLLWGLYAALVSIDLGFLIEGISPWYKPLPNLSLHYFAVGGIGLSTFSMMARVVLGHTGRSVFTPPALLSFNFVLVVLALIFRVIVPAIIPSAYLLSLQVALILWISASLGFLFIFGKSLLLPRVDRRKD